jgi:hypothetical protein
MGLRRSEDDDMRRLEEQVITSCIEAYYSLKDAERDLSAAPPMLRQDD